MRDELDMIPAIVFAKDYDWEDWKERKGAHLVDIEYTDDDIMTLNVFGPKYDYQIQLKISKFLELMKQVGIPTSTGDAP